jgi:hypothetical protein
MRNTAHVTSSKSISDVSAVNPLVAFNDIHGRKGEVLFFCSVPDTTRDISIRHQKLSIPSDVMQPGKC